VYPLVLRALLRLDAERVHRAAVTALRLLQAVPGLRRLLALLVGRPDPVLATTVLGRRFPSPLGMAAGFDKDAEVVDGLGALGFGFVEVGTLTPLAQPGNPRPRLFRLPADRALVNRMGFNNEGAAAAAARLARRGAAARGRTPVGANVGRGRDTAAADAAGDFAAAARSLAPHADYLVVNVSSPNTPGLRDLQAVEALEPILRAVAAEAAAAPGRPAVLVKIAPDLADEDVDAVAGLVRRTGVAGVVAANTTTGRDGLRTAGEAVAAAGAGGLSGPPLAPRAVALLRRLRRVLGEQAVLISVGGVEGADDVWDRLAAGANLVQAYTGVVYGGPLFAARTNRRLARRLRAAGCTSPADVRLTPP
jgi:dihydroorotate dehydrogenase